MTPTPRDWHRRFTQQAAWTASLRRSLLGRVEPAPGERILEVGCGTGAVTARLREVSGGAQVMGLDLNRAYLSLARQNDPRTPFCAGDALALPYLPDTFAAVVCHYFLLWVPRAARALDEMKRVTRRGGAVIAFAEPDYGGRVDYPPPLDELGRQQTQALRNQGAEPLRGRQLAQLFRQAGLARVETGVLGGQWPGILPPEQRQSEWEVLEADLAGALPAYRLADLRQIDERAWSSGERVLFVPTFYAIGWRD